MTGRALIAGLQRMLAGVVLVLSGAYMLIYVYRWEWNRAIISGIFFVAAEIAVASSMILRRLRSLEQRPAAGPVETGEVLRHLREADVERPNPFGWLQPQGTLPVLVPVLLGAGAVLSAIAYVIERVAEATALPAFDRRLAQRMALLAPPDGGLLGGPLGPLPSAKPPVRRSGAGAIRLVMGVTTVALLAWIGGNALAEAAQSRPDPADRPERTAIELAIYHRSPGPSDVASADALWIACRSVLGSLPVTAEVVPGSENRVTLVLRPGIGRLGARRLTGCLADVRLDLVRAEVRDVVSTDVPEEVG